MHFNKQVQQYFFIKIVAWQTAVRSAAFLQLLFTLHCNAKLRLKQVYVHIEITDISVDADKPTEKFVMTVQGCKSFLHEATVHSSSAYLV